MKKTKAERRREIISLRDAAIAGFNRTSNQFRTLEAGFLALLEPVVVASLKKKQKTHVPIQIIRAKVRKIVRDIMKTYFSADDLGKVEIAGDEELSVILQKKLNEYVSHKGSLYTTMRPVVQGVLVYGTAICKVYWSLAKNKLIIQPRSIEEICIDPHARNHFEAKYMVDRFYMTIADVKRLYPKKKIDFSKVVGAASSENDRLKSQEADIGDYIRVEIQDVYRLVDGVWHVSTIIGGDEFLREDERLADGNPIIFGTVYPQFVSIDEKGTVRSYGDSYIAPMIPIQTQYNVSRNQQMDAIDLQLNPRFLTTRTSGLRDDDLSSNKKKIVVSSLESVRELPAPQINQSIFDTNKMDEEIQEVGGLPKFAQGITSSNDPRSATGANLLAENGSVTVDDIITSLNESFFQPLLLRAVKLIYKYEVSADFAGFNRNKDISIHVGINAGVGAMSRETRISSIENALLSLNNTVKLFVEAGLQEKAMEYISHVDQLTREKMQLLGIKDLKKGEEDGKFRSK